MVDTGGRTGIAIAGLILMCIMVFLLYRHHQTNKPAAFPGTSRANRSVVDTHRPPADSRGVPLGTSDVSAQPNEEEKEEIEPLDGVALAESTPKTVTEPMSEPPAAAAAAAATTDIIEPEAEETITPAESPPQEIAKEKEEIDMLRAQLANIAVPNDDEIQVIFDDIERNHDASLSMPDVEKAMIQRKAEFDLKPAIVLRAFQKADTDNDGKISREEFFKFIRLISYYKNLSSLFDAMDTDHNRRLSMTEFLKAAHVMDVDNPDTVFQEMDENKGGYIVFDEFCIWMAEKRHDEDAF